MAAGHWDFTLVSGNDSVAANWVAQTDLTSATSRTVVLNVGQPASIGFSINGLAGEAAYINELRTDVIGYRNGVAVTRGRIVGAQDGIGANGHTVSVTTADYKTLLTRRLLFAGDPELTAWSSTVPNPAVEQRQIAWALIQRTQARTGGNLGITLGPDTDSGVTRNRTYDAGSNLGDLISNLSDAGTGFDWDIDTDMKFRFYYPQRGSSNGYLLDYGGVVGSVSRSVVSSNFTNRLRMNGGSVTDPGTGLTAAQPTFEATGTIGSEGSWETNLTDSTITDSTALAQRGNYELSQRGTIVPAYTVTLNSELWNSSDFWLGDTGNLVVQSGRLNINASVRCIGLSFQIDNDGYETVTATLGEYQPADAYYYDQQDLARRLSELERR